MTKHFLLEALGVIVAASGAMLYTLTPFAQYDLQLLGVIFICYFLFRNIFHRLSYFYVIETLVFIFIIVATVFSTGGVRSPFFFLLYFLLFASSLLLDSATSLVLTLVLIIGFLGTFDRSLTIQNLLPVFSLPFISPFAKYLGDMQRKYYLEKEEMERVIKSKKRLVVQKSYQEEQTLLFLTTALYRHLDELQDRANNFLGDQDLHFIKQKIKALQDLVKNFREYVEKI